MVQGDFTFTGTVVVKKVTEYEGKPYYKLTFDINDNLYEFSTTKDVFDGVDKYKVYKGSCNYNPKYGKLSLVSLIK